MTQNYKASIGTIVTQTFQLAYQGATEIPINFSIDVPEGMIAVNGGLLSVDGEQAWHDAWAGQPVPNDGPRVRIENSHIYFGDPMDVSNGRSLDGSSWKFQVIVEEFPAYSGTIYDILVTLWVACLVTTEE